MISKQQYAESSYFIVILIPFRKLQYSTCQVVCNQTFYTLYGSIQFNSNSYSAKSTEIEWFYHEEKFIL